MTRIKICGLRREEDARRAAALGADFLGFVLAESPRRADPKGILPWVRALRSEHPGVSLVGVFVRPGAAEVKEAIEALSLDFVQVHGVSAAMPFASARPVIRACEPSEWRQVQEQEPWAILLDSASRDGGGGTGRAWDWGMLAADKPARLFVAGGLGADNVAAAIRSMRPFAVDASSRLESSPGCKDVAHLEAFVQAVRAVDEELERGSRHGAGRGVAKDRGRAGNERRGGDRDGDRRGGGHGDRGVGGDPPGRLGERID